METLTITTKGEKLKALKAFLSALNIPFKKDVDETEMTQENFFAMIDDRIKSADAGNTTLLTPDKQKELLGS